MNILITGAASGIARRVIEKLDARKHHIYVAVHTEKQLELVQLRYHNQKHITCLKLDITDKSDREQVKALPIDVLISNAAIGYGGSVAEIPIDLVRDNFNVNVFSNFSLVQIVLKGMIQRKQGRVIMMSSLAGVAPVPFLGSYCASKASINMLTSNLRLEMKLLKANIDVITIQPGLYYTGFNQVMTEDKYGRMNLDTYFKSQLEFLKKYETPFYHLLESKNIDQIASKVVKAIEARHPRAIYRSRPSQILFVKLYSLFFC